MATRKIGKKSSPPARKPRDVPPPEPPVDSGRLQEFRRKIDAVDQRLVRLLNERARLVVEVGKTKRAEGTPIYAPHREAEVLRKVLASNEGPLSDRAVEGIYRELMSGSFALEQPLRIGYLGPPGSNSHAAAVKQFGSSVDYEDLREIVGVFTEVRRGHVNYGLVPIENSLGGGIVETLDAFKANAHQISIYGEVQISVHHALLANCQPRQVRRIHSKPEIFQQCRAWLSTQYPGVELMPAASSSRAAQIAAEECRKALEIGAEPGSAAIGTALAGQLYGLNVLFPRIEDDPNNITRFVIIARQNAQPTGDDKTSLMFTTEDKPGALVSVLGVFQAAGINLSHIDKRPQGRERWTYTFFVDALGHREDQAMAAAVEEAQSHCRELFILGSYPRSRRIL
ncbi:MAG TPA: prephenate dehydratase [Archangium sp.]|jgi:chorismate mutase/prephenate dehydratase|uniref:prephenate dehydratase n=1 Tax=Archangium sp. TaxID=1872627 RepID=UPI002EDBAB40